MSPDIEDTASEPFVKQKVAGKEYTFWELTPYDRADILKRLREKDRQAMEANIKASGLDKEAAYAERAQFDDTKYGEGKFIEYINTPEGECEVFEAALRQDHGDDAPGIARKVRLKNADRIRLLCQLCNLFVPETKPAEPDAEGSDAESPSEPDVYAPQT